MNYKIKLNSIYVCVKDLKRACDFYEAIFGVKPEENHEGMFVVGDFRFLLFDYQSVGDTVVYGDNCLPSFEVDDIQAFIKRLEELGTPIIMPCTRILNNWVMEFRDPEGNDIEAYQMIADQKTI